MKTSALARHLRRRYRRRWLSASLDWFAEDDAAKSVRVVAAAGRDVDLSGLASDYPGRTNLWAAAPSAPASGSAKFAIFNDLDSNPDFEPWRERADLYGYRCRHLAAADLRRDSHRRADH